MGRVLKVIILLGTRAIITPIIAPFGVVVSNGSWDGGPITVSVDGLSVGTFVYKCTVYDTSGNSASDTVPVMVTEKEEEGFPWGTLSLTLGVIGITAVLIAVLAKYKR